MLIRLAAGRASSRRPTPGPSSPRSARVVRPDSSHAHSVAPGTRPADQATSCFAGAVCSPSYASYLAESFVSGIRVSSVAVRASLWGNPASIQARRLRQGHTRRWHRLHRARCGASAIIRLSPSARGFVHAELIAPETRAGRAEALRRRARADSSQHRAARSWVPTATTSWCGRAVRFVAPTRIRFVGGRTTCSRARCERLPSRSASFRAFPGQRPLLVKPQTPA